MEDHMKKQSLEDSKDKHLIAVDQKREKKDWSIPYVGIQEAGRGAFEYEGKIPDVIVRYYSYQRVKFEKERHFAEVIIKKKDMFIVDGIEKDSLIQKITDTAWTIFECRKKLRQARTGVKCVN
jgi:hypothetical protein